MKKITTFLFISSFVLTCQTQNLVSNPNFNEYTLCPSLPAQTTYLEHWKAPTDGTPDFFHACSTGGWVGTPNNYTGSEQPYKDSGYAGLATYYRFFLDTVIHTEYIQTRLKQPLISGELYEVSFMISLCDMSQFTTHIGVHISSDPISLDSDSSFDIEPTFESTLFHSNSNGWQKVSFCFKALGGEEYLTIGNFRTPAETPKIQIRNDTLGDPGWEFQTAYYYIDHVRVVKSFEIDIQQNDTSICDFQNLVLTVYPDSLNYQWMNGEFSDSLVVDHEGIYTVNSLGICKQSDSIYVSTYTCEAEDIIEIPNIFTPNGDGMNDQFKPISSTGLKEAILTIYNRWGLEIYSGDLHTGWNGKIDNQQASAGTYYYEVMFNLDEFEYQTKFGYFTLVR